MKIHLKVNGRVIPASLADNPTAREFAAMLPLTITLHDLFGREKFGALPSPVSARETRTAVCAVGDMICWTAGPDLAIFHRHDDRPISGGFQFLGRVDIGAETFDAPGSLDVTVEMVSPAVEATSAAPRRGAEHAFMAMDQTGA